MPTNDPPVPPGCEEWERHFAIVKDALRNHLISAFLDAELRRVDTTRAALYEKKMPSDTEPPTGREYHTQRFPDGTVLPIPESPRFVFADGEWGWIAGDGANLSLYMLRKGGAGYAWLREWQSCCAVAAELFRAEADDISDVKNARMYDRLKRYNEAHANVRAWRAEFAKADAGRQA